MLRVHWLSWSYLQVIFGDYILNNITTHTSFTSFMPLSKSTLKSGLESAFELSEDNNNFKNGIAAAITSYMSGALYNNGALTYIGSCSPSDFDLPTDNTESAAADTIATGIDNYFSASPQVGIVGVPVNGGLSVIQGTIDHSSVKSDIKSGLLDIFKHVDKDDNKREDKINAITDVIHNAILTITTSHTELMPGSPPTPSGNFSGVIS